MEDIKTSLIAAMRVLAFFGLVSIALGIATGFGVFRVHIENLKTKTVWIFNAPSEESVSLSPEDISCLRNKSCEILEDGTIKVK